MFDYRWLTPPALDLSTLPGLKMRNFKTRARGIAISRCTNVSVDPSLTRRVLVSLQYFQCFHAV
jgi:hypothetical protein